MKQILIAGLILITFSGLGACGSYGGAVDWNMSGDGTLNHPNEGWVYLNAYDIETSHTQYRNNLITYTCSSVRTIYVHGSASMSCSGDVYAHNQRVYGSTSGSYQPSGFSGSSSYSGSFIGSCRGTAINMHQLSNVFPTAGSYMHSNMAVFLSPTPFNMYTIAGNVDCVSNVSLYTLINNSYVFNAVNTSSYYLFDVVDNETYKLIFSNGHEYPFIVNGSNINYDYDACTQHTFHFKELCNNSIPDTDGYYSEYINGVWGVPQFFTASSGTLSISNSSATALQLFTTPFSGIAGWLIDPIVADGVYDVVNPNINWWLKVKIIDDNTSLPLSDVHVSINQSCYATPGIFTSHKNTGANGLVSYDGMSLSNAALHVTKGGYKFLDDNSTGFQATLSGRAGFSGKTWIIRLAPSDSENESSWSEVNGSTYIYFKDITGNKTSRVSDSDANVYLYYENNNSDEETMTLKFQSASTHTYFSDELSWSIPHNEAGYKTIANSYFTPASYSYRAILYNSTIYGWNITKPLSVLTGSQEAIYGNLTTALWFSRASGGKIDFREDMKIVSHACSNNTTLMNVDVELWKDGAYLAHTNLTANDFLTASFKYYDTWNPVFDYVSGSNYSIRMYGFDRTLLETDYVECYTDTVTRRNKLTIMVKSQSGGNLRNSFVFLEGWGQLETGSNYYNSYEGLENGTYRYKASKSGYDGAGWDEIVIADDDETVTYILTSQTSAASHASAKMSDSDVKEIFFPCMFALLIFIVLGGFKYVLK